MSVFLSRLGTIESRIASYSCPRGIRGCGHAIRSRRCFHKLRTPPASLRLLPTTLPRTIAIGRYHGRAEGRVEEPGENGYTASDTDGKVHDELEAIDVRNGEPEWSPTDTIEGNRETFGEQSGSKTFEELQVPHLAWQRKISGYIQAQASPRNRARTGAFGDVLSSLAGKISDSPQFGIEEQKNALFSALRTKDPHAVMKVMLDLAALDQGVPSLLMSLPPLVFSEVLRCMDPKHFLDRHSEIYKSIGPLTMRNLGLDRQVHQEDFYHFSSLFLAQVKDVIDARKQWWPLTLPDYKYLLKCATSVGHAQAAETIWHGMLRPYAGWTMDGTPVKREPLVPDLECYNLYLTVKCWRERANPIQRYRLRVIPQNLAPRHWERIPYALSGHRAGPNHGIKAQVSRLFRRMVQAGIAGNEETFRLMMISLAREGDIQGVEAILKKVWAIDVPALMGGEESQLSPVINYHPSSPFYPSKHFLFTICHVYGINNNIPTALSLIDFISRKYSIPVPLDAWDELLNWTFVLSNKTTLRRKWKDRHGTALEVGKQVGELPPEAVSNLWQTMISDSYNIQPTMEMYNKYMSNLLYRQRYGEMQIRMEEARLLLKRDVLDLTRKNIACKESMHSGTSRILTEERARDLVFALLRVSRNRQYVKRWVRLLLKRPNFSKGENAEAWPLRNIPVILEKWALFLPKTVRYNVMTGTVVLNTQVVRNHRRRSIQRANRGLGVQRSGYSSGYEQGKLAFGGSRNTGTDTTDNIAVDSGGVATADVQHASGFDFDDEDDDGD